MLYFSDKIEVGIIYVLFIYLLKFCVSGLPFPPNSLMYLQLV